MSAVKTAVPLAHPDAPSRAKVFQLLSTGVDPVKDIARDPGYLKFVEDLAWPLEAARPEANLAVDRLAHIVISTPTRVAMQKRLLVLEKEIKSERSWEAAARLVALGCAWENSYREGILPLHSFLDPEDTFDLLTPLRAAIGHPPGPPS
jgi:hypothetical protein